MRLYFNTSVFGTLTISNIKNIDKSEYIKKSRLNDNMPIAIDYVNIWTSIWQEWIEIIKSIKVNIAYKWESCDRKYFNNIKIKNLNSAIFMISVALLW